MLILASIIEHSPGITIGLSVHRRACLANLLYSQTLCSGQLTLMYHAMNLGYSETSRMLEDVMAACQRRSGPFPAARRGKGNEWQTFTDAEIRSERQ